MVMEILEKSLVIHGVFRSFRSHLEHFKVEVLDVRHVLIQHAVVKVFITIAKRYEHPVMFGLDRSLKISRVFSSVFIQDSVKICSFLKQGINIVKYLGAGSVLSLICSYNARESAAEDTCIDNNSGIFGIQSLYLINESHRLRHIKRHCRMNLDGDGNIILLTIGKKGLDHPIRNHGNQTDQMDSEACRLFDLLDQKINGLPACQRSVLVQICVQEYIRDNRFQSSLIQKFLPLRNRLVRDIRRVLEHLVRKDLHTF